MRSLERRLRVLEQGRRPGDWAAYLESMPDADLFRLEAIIITLDDGSGQLREGAWDALSEADAFFLEENIKAKEAFQCVV